MKKIRWELGIGLVGATRSGVIGFDDDATEDEIRESVIDAADNYINIGWGEVERDDG